METHVQPPLYRPLDGFKKEIRTLQVSRPRDPQSVNYLNCHLKIVSLDDRPVCMALSYEWNPQDLPECEAIKLHFPGGHSITLGTNLSALLRAQCNNLNALLWIDAVCINQNDVKERESQISMMSQIYNNARIIMAWLGPKHRGSESGMKLLRMFERACWRQHFAGEWEKRTNLAFLLISCRYLLLDKRSRAQALAGLNEVLERSYWTRQWIIQEISSPTTAIAMICGSQGLDDLATLAIFPFYLLRYHISVNRCPPLLKKMFPPVSLSASLKASAAAMTVGYQVARIARFPKPRSQQHGLLDTLIMLRHSCTSCEHDKIYSILSFQDEVTRRKIPVDYAISWAHLCIRVASHIIGDLENLNVLASAGLNRGHMPSWCPDWTLKRLDYCYGDFFNHRWHGDEAEFHSFALGFQEYSAGGQSTVSNRILCRGENLVLSVLLVGSVESAQQLITCDTGRVLSVHDLSPAIEFITRDDQHYFADLPVYLFSLAYALAAMLYSTSEYWSRNAYWSPVTTAATLMFKRAMEAETASPQPVPAMFANMCRDRWLFRISKPDDLDATASLPQWLAYCDSLQCYSKEKAWWAAARKGQRTPKLDPAAVDQELENSKAAVRNHLMASLGKTFGCCRVEPRGGDKVVVVRGCAAALLIRQVEDSTKYQLVGAAFVHGVMKGQALDKLPEQDVTIV